DRETAGSGVYGAFVDRKSNAGIYSCFRLWLRLLRMPSIPTAKGPLFEIFFQPADSIDIHL
ncbi:MAG: hypothetical protein KDA91_25040, partial [Planctomycetaceae bacterium]|nr:hypothetical protein [Planctomycetaceae bacterium]